MFLVFCKRLRGIRVRRVYLKWFIVALIITGMSLVGGCGINAFLDGVATAPPASKERLSMKEEGALYDRFNDIVARRDKMGHPNGGVPALQNLPRDAAGEVNWTTTVVEGYISPIGSLDPGAEEEAPLNLTIFIEAKVPLMANVLFPHSIHTYWLSCNNCHPKIFIPEAGANPITMDEIFQGKWCGRCHGKVSFGFWPEGQCRRCHVIPKRKSGHAEKW